MSLKAFHIVFVVLSIALAFFCGVWLLNDYASNHDQPELIGGIVSVAAGLALIWYGKSVLRKLKHISYL